MDVASPVLSTMYIWMMVACVLPTVVVSLVFLCLFQHL